MYILTTAPTLADLQWNMVLGGFGLFMFGIKFVGDGLKSLAGDKLRDYINKYTSKTWMALIIGIVITVLIQSSSATTAITIGLVRAGLMKLEQAAGVVIGANIGTTITAFLIGLKIERFSLYFVFLGGTILSFANKKQARHIGEVLIGFGALFYGLQIMGDSLKMLKDVPEFVAFAEAMSNNAFLSLMAGTLLTALIQGSAATIGVIQKIYESGGMTLIAALPFVFGSNIGTTITGAFAAIGGTPEAKRTALLHTFFNIIGTTIGMILLVPYAGFIQWLSTEFAVAPMMQIAVSHIIFNVGATCVFYPFTKQMCKFVSLVIKGDESDRVEVSTESLDTALIYQLPSSALSVAQNLTVQMSNVAIKLVNDTKTYLIEKTSSAKESVEQAEQVINDLDSHITNYLIEISKVELSDLEMKQYTANLQVVKNLERIGDLGTNLIEFYEMVFEAKEAFSQEALQEISSMTDRLLDMIHLSLMTFEDESENAYVMLQDNENKIDSMEYDYRQLHFKRIRDKECTSTVAGSVYCDILGTLERIGDHTMNIARCSLELPSHTEVKTSHLN
ncbi:MAG: Na/Pi cotransporter family protein, partial [Erysipelotrichaceae bacterium]|nr:Na/Pi cotransporter family protein [Erysipelotrichaceae bacterium]